MSHKSPKDFFRPLAVGAPAPLHEIPARPSRAIHFFDPSNEKMAAKVPGMVGTVDVLLGNLEDAVKADNKVAAREGLVRIARETDFGPTQLWTRINALDSPWVLDDLTTLVPAIGDKLDVIMVPKVQGPEDIHYVDRLLAQLEAKAGLERPILVHAILETARGMANVEEICGASPRMQGLSLGPADLAADRKMKTTPRRRRPPGLPRAPGPAARRRRHRAGGGAAQRLPAGPLALHDREDGRRLRDPRDLPLLRALRRHRRRGGLRGPVPQRVPPRLRRHLDPPPEAGGDRQPGLLPQRRGRHARPPGGRGDGRRHRRGDDRRQDGGRRLPQAVPGDGRAGRAAGRRRPRARGALRRHRLGRGGLSR
ncbi:aldolase/citrate lyase family protein [Nocardioides sp. TF02-7]|uniref:HpcH/HpaI aldolase/citrate lyase family protein n=1 Tax=Nocardioides sp. TF02-7 TaxID=2917724 RepID=UPI001F068C18|nr:aldolase/citrate lyase family protein [Nocardioides sp. TF02-7]UMG94567.1 aldolase/citrate lyase family protein [Nocardioides sp. TF02-7]